MNKVAGPLVLSAALLGVVGGGVWAGSHAFAPVKHEPQVVNVQNAGQPETVAPSPTTTTKPVVKVAPKPVAKPAPVKSAVKKAPARVVAPQPVQRQAVVSETPADPQPTDPPAAPAPLGPPPVQGGAGNYVCSPSGCETQAP